MVFRVTVVPMVIVLKVVLMSMMILVLVTRTKVMIPPHSKYYIDIKDDGDEVDDAWWQLLLVAESGDWYLGGRDVLRVCLYICVCVRAFVFVTSGHLLVLRSVGARAVPQYSGPSCAAALCCWPTWLNIVLSVCLCACSLRGVGLLGPLVGSY